MLVRMQTSSGGGGSAEAKEMSFVNGSSVSASVMNYNDTTNETVTPTASYVWNGNYIQNNFSTSPRSFKALAPCTATVFKADGTRETKTYNTNDIILEWQQSSFVGTKPFQVGVIVM